jgi:glycosyltransferase involved in cell wall biosynthesis
VRVVLDATPLFGVQTGVGRYTSRLLTELAGGPLEMSATAFTWRSLERLPSLLPPGVRPAARRMPARLLRAAWARTEQPPVEILTGPVDVMHATNFVLPPMRRAKGVLTVHDMAYLRMPETVSVASTRYRELVPKGLRRAAAVVTPSQAVADELVDAYHLNPSLVTATPLGVDPDWFTVPRPTPEWLAARGLPERYLLFVGTAEPRKNLPGLLAAYQLLRDSDPDAPALALAGPPGWGPVLDVAGMPRDAVIPLGFIHDSVLRPVVAGATALCLPSLYEGFGLPVLEAMAAGTPVVASDIPTTREVAGETAGGCVRMVDPADNEALAQALVDVAASPPEAEPGRKRAATFTWRQTAERTRAIYERIAG